MKKLTIETFECETLKQVAVNINKSTLNNSHLDGGI